MKSGSNMALWGLLTAAIMPWLVMGDGRADGQQHEGVELARRVDLGNPKIRAKKVSSNICEAGVQQEAGLIDIKDRDIFYWYFPSQDKPRTDPVVLYLGGVPGRSNVMVNNPTMFPCMIDPKNHTATVPNPFSWNRHANLVILEQFPGVGYSSWSNATHISSESLSLDALQFLDSFYRRYPQLVRLPLHLATQSFGAPMGLKLSRAILTRNREYSQIRNPIPVSSLIIGNGAINPSIQLKVTQPPCGARDTSEYCTCVTMVEQCTADPAGEDCSIIKFNCFFRTTVLVDMSTQAMMQGDIDRFFNVNATVKGMGLPKKTEFNSDSFNAIDLFSESFDVAESGDADLDFILDQGLRVLLYSGARSSKLFPSGNLERYLNQRRPQLSKFFPSTTTNLTDPHNQAPVGRVLVDPDHPLGWIALANQGNFKDPWERPDLMQLIINRWIRNLPLL